MCGCGNGSARAYQNSRKNFKRTMTAVSKQFTEHKTKRKLTSFFRTTVDQNFFEPLLYVFSLEAFVKELHASRFIFSLSDAGDAEGRGALIEVGDGETAAAAESQVCR